jgi:hypothetical protein
VIVCAFTVSQGKSSSSPIPWMIPDWLVKQYGGGVMIVEPQVFGTLFIDAPVSHYEDLEFVSRGT